MARRLPQHLTRRQLITLLGPVSAIFATPTQPLDAPKLQGTDFQDRYGTERIAKLERENRRLEHENHLLSLIAAPRDYEC